MNRVDREAGALLIELIIAVVVLSIVAVAIGATLSATSVLEVNNQARNRLAAAGESLIERTRSDTTWMTSSACVATLDDGGSCDLSWIFDGSGTAQVDENLVDPAFGLILVEATASAVDSPDDGVDTADADGNRIDFYAVSLRLQFEDVARIAPGLKPLVLMTEVDPSLAQSTGSLALQVCRVRDQVDERIAIHRCGVGRQERMAPPARWNVATGGTSPDDQAYTCAHPDHFRAPTSKAFVNAPETGSGALNTKCFTADGPYAEPMAPSYEPAGNFFGQSISDKFAKFSPRATTLPDDVVATTWNDRYRYVSTVIEPVAGSTVMIQGVAGTTTDGVTRTGTTNAQGLIEWTGLTPGRYTLLAGAAPSGTRLSTELSVPGSSVTVSHGIKSRATQVFIPNENKQVVISLATPDISYPWGVVPEGWRIPNNPGGPVYVVGPWNPAWPQGINRTHSNWLVYNLDGSPQPLCIAVRAAPWGRLSNGGRTVCRHQAPVTHYTFSDLAAGLYSFEILGVPGFVWRRENTPGFIWVNEDGSTYPASSGAWGDRARARYYGCVDLTRQYAINNYDPSLPPPPCGAATTSGSGDDGGGGTG
jgi:type II secretory pathway pseudopilin PulG